MKVGIICLNIQRVNGGAELSCVRLANSLVKRGHKVVIFYNGQGDQPDTLFMCAQLESSIELIDLDLGKHIDKNINLNRINAAREKIILNKIDIAVGFALGLTNSIFVDLLYCTAIPLIISPRSSTQDAFADPSSILEYKLAMLAADSIHVQIESYKYEYPAFLRDRITAIPNYIYLPNFDLSTSVAKKEKIILAVGRLDELQKRFSSLIHAFALIANKFPDWKVVICGKGEARRALCKLIKNYGLENRIELPGIIDKLEPYYLSSTIFCIPSAKEGFPNTLSEALTYALPAVGFADCPGVNELIKDKLNGILVEQRTNEGLAKALSTLIENQALCLQYGQAAHELMKQYDSEITTDKWEELLKNTVLKKPEANLERERLEKEYYERTFYERYGPAPLGSQAQLAKIKKRLSLVSFPRFWQRILLTLYKPFVKKFVPRKLYKIYRDNPVNYFENHARKVDTYFGKFLSFFGPKPF